MSIVNFSPLSYPFNHVLLTDTGKIFIKFKVAMVIIQWNRVWIKKDNLFFLIWFEDWQVEGEI